MLAKSVPAAGGGAAPDYILIRDEKPSGTQGGTFTAGAWQTRDLTTKVHDDGSHASLASNQITLAAGTYEVKAHALGYAVNQHKLKLYNVTDVVDIIIGTAEFASSPTANRSFVEGKFTLASSKVLELQHRCSATKTTDGLGRASVYEIEVYSVIEFWKVA